MIDIGEAPFVDVAPPVRAYRQALVALLYLFFSAYLRYGISRFPPGLARALLAAPIFVANTAVPFFFSNKEELLQRLVLVFILTWLANSKVSEARVTTPLFSLTTPPPTTLGHHPEPGARVCYTPRSEALRHLVKLHERCVCRCSASALAGHRLR